MFSELPLMIIGVVLIVGMLGGGTFMWKLIGRRGNKKDANS